MRGQDRTAASPILASLRRSVVNKRGAGTRQLPPGFAPGETAVASTHQSKSGAVPMKGMILFVAGSAHFLARPFRPLAKKNTNWSASRSLPGPCFRPEWPRHGRGLAPAAYVAGKYTGTSLERESDEIATPCASLPAQRTPRASRGGDPIFAGSTSVLRALSQTSRDAGTSLGKPGHDSGIMMH